MLGLSVGFSSAKVTAMSGQRWPTLSAALFAVVVHTILLGIAASLGVSRPHEPRTLVTITLTQPAAPLPVAKSEGEKLHTASAPVPLPILPSRTPPQRKRSVAPKPLVTRTPSPVARVPRIQPSPPPSKETPPPEDAPRLAAILPTVPTKKSEESAESFLDENSRGSDRGVEEASGNGDAGNTTTSGALVGRSNEAGASGGKGTQGNGTSTLAQPHYGVNPKPVYPLLARRMGAQGEVLLRVHVQQDGSVAAVELARSSGSALLDEAATRTVRDSWRFIPARLNGVAIESWVEIPIKFVLAES